MKIKLLGEKQSLSYVGVDALPTIGNVDGAKVGLDYLLKLYDDYYRVIAVAHPPQQDDYCVVRYHNFEPADDESDTAYLDYIQCPYCGHRDYLGSEYNIVDTYCCRACSAESELIKQVEVTYTTKLLTPGVIVDVK